jgi:hypothetical protein
MVLPNPGDHDLNKIESPGSYYVDLSFSGLVVFEMFK